jgi:hypothetical protein
MPEDSNFQGCYQPHRYVNLLTYSRTWALLEEPPIVQPLKDFVAFYGTRRFNTVFTRALHWSLSWVISIQFTPSHPVFLRSILILSTHLRRCLHRYVKANKILDTSCNHFMGQGYYLTFHSLQMNKILSEFLELFKRNALFCIWLSKADTWNIISVG